MNKNNETEKFDSPWWLIASCVGILWIIVLMPGCATKGSTVQQVSAQSVEPPPRVKPVESMVDCAKPAALEDGSFGAVVRKLSEALGMLDECAGKQKHLGDWIKESK